MGVTVSEAALQIRLVRSPAGRKPRHRRTLEALGLRRVGQSVQHTASPEILGMVRQVAYLLAVEQTGGERA